MIRYLWNATVRGVTFSTAATCFIERPSASNCSTSRCRGVSSARGFGWPLHERPHQPFGDERRHVRLSLHHLAHAESSSEAADCFSRYADAPARNASAARSESSYMVTKTNLTSGSCLDLTRRPRDRSRAASRCPGRRRPVSALRRDDERPTVGRRDHDVAFGREQLLERAEHQRVIVREQDSGIGHRLVVGAALRHPASARLSRSTTGTGRRGTLISSRVPRAGLDRIVTLPPSISSLSLMLTRPIPFRPPHSRRSRRRHRRLSR